MQKTNWFSIILDDVFIIYEICDDTLGYSLTPSPFKIRLHTHTHTDTVEDYSAIKNEILPF